MKLKTLLISAISALVASVLVVGAQVPGVNSTLASVFTLAYEVSTAKASYSATVGFSIPSNATDVCALSGSATKTVRLRRIILTGGATAVVTDPVEILRRTTVPGASTGAIAVAKVPYDTTSVAATAALAEAWTVAPTVTGALALADPILTFNNYTTGTGSGTLTYSFGAYTSPTVLRGISQFITVGFGGVAPAGAKLTCTFEWTEDTDS